MDQTVGPLEAAERFAGYVAILGRGLGRSRALTREEARDAFGLVLAGRVHPAQLGAFLMLLRYRGEDPEEITGLVEAARAALPARGQAELGPVDLDWPSYGAGRSRGAPWFLLAALALARSGRRILMHGTNEFTGGVPVADALRALGLAPAHDAPAVRAALAETGFAYWPAADAAPAVDRLLGMRRLFGLRSPVNTVARLLDPADAGRSVDGVFHPPYIALHLAVAERLERHTLLVLKGGGGEAERAPGKATEVHLWRRDGGLSSLVLPALLPVVPPRGMPEDAALVAAVWDGRERPDAALATVQGTITMALLALDPSLPMHDAERRGAELWAARGNDRVVAA